MPTYTFPGARVSLPCYRFGLFTAHDALASHAVFTRHGGTSPTPFESLNVSYTMGDDPALVQENRKRCLAELGRSLPDLTVAGLVHGAAVGIVERSPRQPAADGSSLIRGVDSLITATPRQALMITAADCLQVLLLDPRTPAIGLVHAGWRGLVANAIEAAVQAMTAQYGSQPEQMIAGVGPGLGPCCSEFTDPLRELPAGFAPHIHGRYVDLRGVAADQLGRAGLRTEHVEHLAICTRCHRDEFFSHRGDQGRTGRFAAILSLQLSTEDRGRPDSRR